MLKLELNGKTFELRFNMLTIDEMEKEAGEGKSFLNFAQENLSDFRKIFSVLPVLLRGNNSKTPDEEWFKNAMRDMDVGQIINLQKKIMAELTSAMTMETDEQENDGPVDVVLNEIRKKDRADG